MKRTRLMLLAAMFLLICVTSHLAIAGEHDPDDKDEKNQESEWDYSDLGKGEFGSVLYGPEFTKDQLKDKVVLVVVFGCWTTDGNALKDIAKLVARYRKKGFVAIGVRYFAKGNSGKSIVTIAEDLKIKTIPIVDYVSIDIERKKRKGVKNTSGRVYVPYGVLYGRDGNAVWERRYVGAQKEVTRLLRRELKKKSKTKTKTEKTTNFEEILGVDEFPQSAMIVKHIKAGRLGTAYLSCEKYSDSEGEVGTEASELKELVKKYHEEQLELFEEQKTAAPTDAIETLRGISKTFRGTEFSKEAKKTQAELKKDKDFKVLLKSHKEYGRIMGNIEKIPDPPADDDDYKKWKRRYKAKIAGLFRKIETFKKKYPESPFTPKLEDAMVPLDTEA